jgi:hypothetical protein
MDASQEATVQGQDQTANSTAIDESMEPCAATESPTSVFFGNLENTSQDDKTPEV